MPDIVNLHGDPIVSTIEVEEEESTQLKQRIIFISQAQHTLDCLKLELQNFVNQNHPEVQGASNLGISPDAKSITYS
jgi:hypothetical protein